jgi:hypothetical protein
MGMTITLCSIIPKVTVICLRLKSHFSNFHFEPVIVRPSQSKLVVCAFGIVWMRDSSSVWLAADGEQEGKRGHPPPLFAD